MLIQVFITLTLGILAGTITGLFPGIHINLVGAILIYFSITLLEVTIPTILIIFIVAMAITHTFIDFIPSIFLGAPDEDTVLSILPGHELLKQGRAYEAIILTTYGSLFAILVVILISPIFILFLSQFENIIRTIIPYILIISTIFLISRENYKLTALIIFLLSGFLGFITLNSDLIKQPFLPMLSGLFGASALIISIINKTTIPKQTIKKIKLNKKHFTKPILVSAISAPFCCLIPALGSGQAAVIGASLIKSTRRNFLVLIGAINTIIIGLSFIIYYIIGKTRTGIAATLEKITKSSTLNLTFNHILIILVTIILVGIICFYYTIFLSKIFSKNIHKINYTKLSILIIIIISSIVLIFSQIYGFFIFLIATIIGLFGILSRARRINLMGCLVIPIVINYVF